MRVLNLVTNADAEFYQLQREALVRRGVREQTLAVPGDRTVGDEGEESGRTLADYLTFFPQVLRSAVDGFDVVHANYGLTAPAAITQVTSPVVVSLWGSDLFGRYGSVVRWCARRADAVVVMSEDMAGALDCEAHVIPHGVDLERFRPMPQDAARAALGWREDARHVLFPYARGRPVKDFPRAERTVEAARADVDGDVVLQTVRGVAHDRMPLYYNAADVLLLTSKHEGSPNAVKEALACNLPVVSTDVGDVCDRLADVDPARVATTDEELRDGLVDVLRAGPPSNGRTAVRSLGVDRMGERLEAVYRDVTPPCPG